MIYLQLLWEFLQVGLFAIGGGMAAIPFLYNISDKTGWFTHAQIADMIAVSESTPGPIGVNMATFAGYQAAGVPGAVVATLGLILPSTVIVLIVALFLKSFRNNRYVNAAFYGLRPASTGLIAAAGLSVIMISLVTLGPFEQSGSILDLFHWKGLILAAVIYVLTNFVRPTKKLHPVVYIAASAAIGILFQFEGLPNF